VNGRRLDRDRAVLRLDARNGETKTLVPAHEGRAATGLKLAWGRRLFVSGGPTGKAFVYRVTLVRR
jgi:hypothetical protein